MSSAGTVCARPLAVILWWLCFWRTQIIYLICCCDPQLWKWLKKHFYHLMMALNPHNKCFNSVCMLLLSFLNKTFVLLFVFFPFIRNSGWWGLNKPTTKPSNMMMMTNRFTFISSVTGTYHPHQRRHSSAPPCLDTWSLMHFSCLCLWRKLNNYLWSESRRRNVYLHSIFKVAE